MPIEIVFLFKCLLKLLTFFLLNNERAILIAEFSITLFYKQYRTKNKELHNERFFKNIKRRTKICCIEY